MALPADQQLVEIRTAEGVLQCIVDAAASPESPLLVYHHGTPAAGPIAASLLGAARAADLRTVELVRPGYGNSSRASGRTVADNARLTQRLVDHLETPRFLSAGWSGGGPHTLADAALLPGCVGSLCIAGVGPHDAPDLDFLDGMGQDNLDEFAAAAEPEALAAYLAAAVPGLSAGDGASVKAALASLLPDSDLAYLSDAFADELAAQAAWSLANGIWGWFDDDRAFFGPWGFDLSRISKPVTILQGSDDLMVPLAHGRWLAAHIPDATAHFVAGEGHLSVAAKHLDAAVAQLRRLLS